MDKFKQSGMAPVGVISGLLILGLITAAGTYLILEYSQPKQNPVISVPNPEPIPSVTESKNIEEVKQTNEEALLNMEGVDKVEVGEKDGEPCVIVFTFEKTDELENLENNGLDGYKVVIQDSEQP